MKYPFDTYQTWIIENGTMQRVPSRREIAAFDDDDPILDDEPGTHPENEPLDPDDDYFDDPILDR